MTQGKWSVVSAGENCFSCFDLLTCHLMYHIEGPMTVGYEMEVYTAAESQGMVKLSISVTDPPTGGALRPFALVVNTENATASIQVLCVYNSTLMTLYIRSK